MQHQNPQSVAQWNQLYRQWQMQQMQQQQKQSSAPQGDLKNFSIKAALHKDSLKTVSPELLLTTLQQVT